MLRSTFLRFAANSAIALPAMAARQPRYGGVLRLAVSREAAARYRDPRTLPAVGNLVFETLLRFGENDRLLPSLATAWRLSNGPKREWTFTLRPGLRFHDKTVCDAAAVASALNGDGLRVIARGALEVAVTPESAAPLFRELAELRRAIARGAPLAMAGTGPFRTLPAVNALLRLGMYDGHWEGRPFLDEVQVIAAERDPLLAVESGAAALGVLPVEQAPRAAQRGVRVWRSKPVELIGVEAVSLPEPARKAVSLAIDRESIHRAILQGEGAPSASLLPDWMSGYGFLFPMEHAPARTRELLATMRGSLSEIRVHTEGDDPLLRTVASRVALDLGAAGIPARLDAGPRSDGDRRGIELKVRRWRLLSQQPAHALRQMASELAIPFSANLRTAQSVYEAERNLLAVAPVIPLAHIPEVYAAGEQLRSVTALPVDSLGRLHLDQLWLDEYKERG